MDALALGASLLSFFLSFLFLKVEERLLRLVQHLFHVPRIFPVTRIFQVSIDRSSWVKSPDQKTNKQKTQNKDDHEDRDENDAEKEERDGTLVS